MLGEYSNVITTVTSYVQHTLLTYQSTGFFDVITESIIFFNEIDETKKASVSHYPVRVIGSAQNVYVGRAMIALFRAARSPYCVFLEKDFSILVSPSLVVPELQQAVRTLQTAQADIYQLRCLFKMGYPNWAILAYRGGEDALVAQNHTHLCTLASWINNTVERWPHIFQFCDKNDNAVSSQQRAVCVYSDHCNWTNNPFMISRLLWTRHFEASLRRMLHRHEVTKNMSRHDRDANLVEPWFTAQEQDWRWQHFRVAVGPGIFTHHEVDG